MFSYFTIRTNSLRFPNIPTSSTGNFWFCSYRIFTTKCRKTRCNRKPSNRTQINLDIGYRFSSALLMCYSTIINISLKVMINDWLSPTNIIVYRTLFIGSRSFRRMNLKLLFKFWFVCVEVTVLPPIIKVWSLQLELFLTVLNCKIISLHSRGLHSVKRWGSISWQHNVTCLTFQCKLLLSRRFIYLKLSFGGLWPHSSKVQGKRGPM